MTRRARYLACVLLLDCPACRALPGQPCRSISGRTTFSVASAHVPRHRYPVGNALAYKWRHRAQAGAPS